MPAGMRQRPSFEDLVIWALPWVKQLICVLILRNLTSWKTVITICFTFDLQGKNRPSKRHRKKQTNIIEERKGQVQQRMDEEAKRRAAKAEREAAAVPEGVPKALERFYKGVRR